MKQSLVVGLLAKIIGLVCACLLISCSSEGGGDNRGDSDGDGDSDSDGNVRGDSETNGHNDSNGTEAPTSVKVEDYEAICADRAHAHCYYVSNSGQFPQGTQTHQLTIEEVSNRDFTAGDIILFRRGDQWRTHGNNPAITMTSSGTSDAYIVYSAYGEGKNPRLLGSVSLENWRNSSGNIWTSSTIVDENPIHADYGAQLFFEKKSGSAFFGHFEESADGLDTVGDWTYNSGQISVVAPNNPSELYASVEAPVGQRLIMLSNQEYVGVDSLTLRYMINAGIYDNYANGLLLQGLRVTNCEIAYIGVKNSGSAYGVALDRSDVTIAANEIHDCGRRSVSLVLYNTAPSVIRDVVIEGNHFYNGYHTTGVDIQSNAASSGGHVIENITIRGNLFASDPDYTIGVEDNTSSNLIFTKEDEGSTLRDVYIHNNIFMYAPGSGIKTLGGENYYIHNNTFYGFNASYDNYQAQIFTGNEAENVVIQNNVFFNDAPDNRYACIEMGAGRHDYLTLSNNLYFTSTYAHARLLWADGGTSYFFDETEWTPFESATGWDAPLIGNPLFVDAPGDLTPSAASPAVGAGVLQDWINVDYWGRSIKIPPDCGAIQSL